MNDNFIIDILYCLVLSSSTRRPSTLFISQSHLAWSSQVRTSIYETEDNVVDFFLIIVEFTSIDPLILRLAKSLEYCIVVWYHKALCRLQIQCLRHTAISSLLSHCYLITYTTLPSFHMCACSRYWWRGSVHQGERDSHYYGRIFSNPRWLSRWEGEKTEESGRRRENWREW